MSAPKPDVTVAALLARIRRLGSPDPDTSAADLLRDIDALSAIVVDATWGDRRDVAEAERAEGLSCLRAARAAALRREGFRSIGEIAANVASLVNQAAIEAAIARTIVVEGYVPHAYAEAAARGLVEGIKAGCIPHLRIVP